MSKSVIEVENLSKRYNIGRAAAERSGTLHEAMTEAMRSFWTRGPAAPAQASEEEFWALKDVSFDVQPGERLGIIGRNGAGKTTLLKVLSRITAPTEGRVRIRGRVASLLEVGTGFHPELTGRENIYLNGAILGMKKAEISRKFDQIVAFAEVEKFLDTPVKRYSSGMYVRLAFAVAAHLDPEVLVIDEVLAVGDARFQQKCLGKMREVTGEGRTLLFVTHQMGMVAQLCNKAMLLQDGRLTAMGLTETVIAQYLKTVSDPGQSRLIRTASAGAGKDMAITEAESVNSSGVPTAQFGTQDEVGLRICCRVNRLREDAVLGISVKDQLGRRAFTSQIRLKDHGIAEGVRDFSAKVLVPGEFLTSGDYSVLMALHIPNVETLDLADEVCRFAILDTGSEMALHEGKDFGCVFAKCRWEVRKG
jgi:lipopolysaccharide transport system ATP-binding protein